MNNIIEIESDTTGLWGRFIPRLILALIFTYYGSIILLGFLNIILNTILFLVFIIFALVFVTWKIFKENPLKWKNRVSLDFIKKEIIINNKRTKPEKSNLLDYEGKKYSFHEIDNYSVIHYDSFMTSSYYLVKIFVKGEEIKLLSFKEADKFSDFIRILDHQLKIKVKD